MASPLRSRFRGREDFSAEDLASLLAAPESRTTSLAEVLNEVSQSWEGEAPAEPSCTRQDVPLSQARQEPRPPKITQGHLEPEAAFLPARILHSLGTAVETLAAGPDAACASLFPGLAEALTPPQTQWLSQCGLEFGQDRLAGDWARRARALAFEHLQRAIVGSGETPSVPRNVLRSDEIVWGRAPARLDLAGGWTDTPPFSLEHGGCVANAAVLLNGQPPIQVYARVTREPLVRIHSIDLGTDCLIRRWEELLDFRSATGEFSLVKAALVLAGFAPPDVLNQTSEVSQTSEVCSRFASPSPGNSLDDLLERFGGGLELTTLAAVPKGSGLGTSSIMGAVVLAVIHRVLGRRLSDAQLFHAVLRLEQALTTGGGWQDQVGGTLEGVKLIATKPGLVPATIVRYLPPDVLDPKTNGARTLLYYTGLTRLAKNILAQVVGRYLNRDRNTLATLQRIHALAPEVADAMARKDLPAFGQAIDAAWQLNKQLDPDSSNPQLEALLGQVRPHLHGAKLLGAGGGGFLLLVCKSARDADQVKHRLDADPPNPRARFFDFAVSGEGLSISVC